MNFSIQETRQRFFEYFAERGAKGLKTPDEYGPLDDTIVYCLHGDKEFGVTFLEDVTWGPEFDIIKKSPDEFRDTHLLEITIPNSLRQREPIYLPNMKNGSELMIDWH